MIAIIRHCLHHPAKAAILLRGGLVAGNIAVLSGLALLLGLDGFGALIVAWGLALVGSTLLGFGGPLTLLARLGAGQGMHPLALGVLCFGLPGLAALLVLPVLHLIWPAMPWAAVLALAVAINLAACLASVLRALGVLHLSMALRDAAPLLALGLAGLSGGGTAPILWLTAALLGLICLLAVGLCLRDPGCAQIIGREMPAAIVQPGLWASAVLGMVLAQVDIILGGQLLSAEQIGLYALLRRIANLVALPVTVATWVSAGPISAAHAANDLPALQQASLSGARIAVWPGLALALLALASLPVLVWSLPDLRLPVLWPVLLVLLAGTLVQLICAQGVTVASLTGHGDLAARARLAGVLGYLAAVASAPAPDPLRNALCYALGLCLCHGLLWLWLWRATGVNTLAFQIGGRAWRMS
ncbi:MAG: hypothetical protein II336_02270 [Loktanella sp.]|nr:hypothetical protein [Loktanella sp.]